MHAALEFRENEIEERSLGARRGLSSRFLHAAARPRGPRQPDDVSPRRPSPCRSRIRTILPDRRQIRPDPALPFPLISSHLSTGAALKCRHFDRRNNGAGHEEREGTEGKKEEEGTGSRS